MTTKAFAAAAFSAAFCTTSAFSGVAFDKGAFNVMCCGGKSSETPIIGGANPWGEKAKDARGITQERIRKAKDEELRKILAELRNDGILPPEVTEEVDYSKVRSLYAEQLAQIARQTAEMYERQRDEEDLMLLMMMD